MCASFALAPRVPSPKSQLNGIASPSGSLEAEASKAIAAPAVAWAAAAIAAVGGWFEVGIRQWEQARFLFWLDLALGAVAFGLLFLRRRHPVLVVALITLIGAASYSSAGPAVLAVVSMATRRRLVEIVPLSVLGMGVAFVFLAYQPVVEEPLWLTLLFTLVVTIALAATGMYIGSRRELLWNLRNRAERAELEQELRLSQARSTERARIAGEMHDVVAHRITQVSMQAGALAFRDDLDGDRLREGLGQIQRQANDALHELRDVLGVLREDDASQPTARPQPTYDDIAQWVPNGDHWRELLLEAETQPPSAFARNGWAVGALQAAWSAITHTPVPTGGHACSHLVGSLTTATRIGHDTDTVAAIAGQLLGARYGASAVPARWRRMVHGWPGLRARDLVQLAVDTAGRGGQPSPERLDYVYRHHYKMFPVVDGGRLVGCVGLRDIKELPRERWGTTPISAVMSAGVPQEIWTMGPKR